MTPEKSGAVVSGDAPVECHVEGHRAAKIGNGWQPSVRVQRSHYWLTSTIRKGSKPRGKLSERTKNQFQDSNSLRQPSVFRQNHEQFCTSSTENGVSSIFRVSFRSSAESSTISYVEDHQKRQGGTNARTTPPAALEARLLRTAALLVFAEAPLREADSQPMPLAHDPTDRHPPCCQPVRGGGADGSASEAVTLFRSGSRKAAFNLFR